MKISIKDHKNYTELCYIESGEVFRPVNSQQVYMKLYNETCDDCWNQSESRLFNLYENPQDHEVENIYEETRPCVDMVTGEIIFFHQDLRVVKLNYVLEVEG
jgi:hypothetical protein